MRLNGMINFSDRSIQSKLTIIIESAVISCCLLLSSVLIYQKIDTFENKLDQELTSLSKLIAERANAAVLFVDTNEMQQILGSIELHPSIETACIYNADLVLLAGIAKEEVNECFESLSVLAERDTFHYQSVSEPIISDEFSDVVDGYVYLIAHKESLHDDLRAALIAILITILGVMLAGIFFSRLIFRYITQPLNNLNEATKNLSDEKGFVRVEKLNNDELGVLTETFNEFGQKLVEQEKQISAHSEMLESQIKERTNELMQAVQELKAFSFSVSHDLKGPVDHVRIPREPDRPLRFKVITCCDGT